MPVGWLLLTWPTPRASRSVQKFCPMPRTTSRTWPSPTMGFSWMAWPKMEATLTPLYKDAAFWMAWPTESGRLMTQRQTQWRRPDLMVRTHTLIFPLVSFTRHDVLWNLSGCGLEKSLWGRKCLRGSLPTVEHRRKRVMCIQIFCHGRLNCASASNQSYCHIDCVDSLIRRMGEVTVDSVHHLSLMLLHCHLPHVSVLWSCIYVDPVKSCSYRDLYTNTTLDAIVFHIPSFRFCFCLSFHRTRHAGRTAELGWATGWRWRVPDRKHGIGSSCNFRWARTLCIWAEWVCTISGTRSHGSVWGPGGPEQVKPCN